MKYGYYRKIWHEEGIVTPITLNLWTYPMTLLTGGSGSGKTTALIYLIGMLLKEHEPIELTICDFKGIDFAFLTEYPLYYSGDDVYDGVLGFYRKYTEARQAHDSSNKRILIVDEYQAAINYFTTRDKLEKTKRASEVLSAISEILCLGRGITHGCWLCTQRANAELFQGGSRDNAQIIIGLGRLSREQKQMLFGGEDIPEDEVYSVGEGLLLADGKELTEVKYPMISDLGDWKSHIRQILLSSDEKVDVQLF